MTTILLVEDEPLIRELVSAYLRQSGFTLLLAEDGMQAVATASQTQPSLILLDMGLPKLSGWQTIQQLRANDTTARIPIIALTAYAMDDDRQRALELGCDAFEPKPIDFVSLIARMRALIADRAGTAVEGP
jgi:DNA-binding response OmpR family regulator